MTVVALGFSLGFLLILVASAELYLRWLMNRHWDTAKTQQDTQSNLQIHQKSADAKLVYELRPGASTVREGILYQNNLQGFRDDEFTALPPLKDEYRIVVIGDSVAWGWGVEMAQAWPQQLEKLLGETHGKTIRVYNMAVNGYSTQQEVRLLETKGLAYQPDLVILNYALNDPTIEEGGMWPYFQPITRWEVLYRAKIFYAGIKRAWRQYSQDPSAATSKPWDYTGMIHEALFDQVETGFEDLRKLQQQHQFKMLLMVTPLFDFKKNGPYAHEDIHQMLGNKSETYQFEFLDTQPSFKGLSGKTHSVDLIHPNVKGHTIISHAVAEKINSEKWIP